MQEMAALLPTYNSSEMFTGFLREPSLRKFTPFLFLLLGCSWCCTDSLKINLTVLYDDHKYYRLAFKMTISVFCCGSQQRNWMTYALCRKRSFQSRLAEQSIVVICKMFAIIIHQRHSYNISYKLFQKVWHCSSLLWKSLRSTRIWLPSKGFIGLFSSETHCSSKCWIL